MLDTHWQYTGAKKENFRKLQTHKQIENIKKKHQQKVGGRGQAEMKAKQMKDILAEMVGWGETCDMTKMDQVTRGHVAKIK